MEVKKGEKNMAYVGENAAWQLLGKVIVVRAAEDYGNALLGHFKTNGRKDPIKNKSMLDECRRFFLSEDLPLYTKIPGEAIMKEVEEQVKYWPKRRKFVMPNVI